MTVSLSSFAQTDTSEVQKLRHYKQMYKEGLIDSGEYSQLKQSILFKRQSEPKPQKTLEELKRSYRGKIIGGAILVPISVAFGAGAFVYSGTLRPEASATGLLVGTSVVSGVVGVALLVSGIVGSAVYHHRKELTAGLLNSGNVGVAMTF